MKTETAKIFEVIAKIEKLPSIQSVRFNARDGFQMESKKGFCFLDDGLHAAKNDNVNGLYDLALRAKPCKCFLCRN
jgi:hypothetical protein